MNRALPKGNRVILRRPSSRDRDEFLDRARASRKLHGRWVVAPSDPDAFAAYLQRAKGTDVESLLVCRREDGAIVGMGFMREGIRLVLRHAFGPLGLHRLEANIQPGNDRSLALVKEAGFRCEGFSPRYLKIGGRWRDHERWAILAEDLHTPRRGRRT